jgi:hypothetical protein
MPWRHFKSEKANSNKKIREKKIRGGNKGEEKEALLRTAATTYF